MGYLICVTCYAGRLHREGSGLPWEASRYVTPATQAVWWSNADAMVHLGVGGNEKAWIDVRLGLVLSEHWDFEKTPPSPV